MQKTITAKVVNSAKPNNKPYEIWDTDITGLILRVESTGFRTYYLQYRISGKRKRLRLGPADAISPYQARELAKAQLADVYRGEDPAQKKKQISNDAYQQFLDEVYKPWLDANARHPENTYDTLVKGFPELHRLKLNEITPPVIEKWRTRRLNEGIKPITINRQLSDLKACLNRAVDIWGVMSTNPIAKVKSTRTDNSPKIRYLTKEEEISLRQALDKREEQIRADRISANEWRTERDYAPYADLSNHAFVDHLKPAIVISLNTGLRRGELLKLKWEDVNFEERNLTVAGETSKTGKTRHIPLNDEALTILKQWKEQPGIKSAFVFTGKDGKPFFDLKTAWNNVLRKAKIHNFRWHDLRHSFASKLVMSGVDLNTVRELLGHSDYKMTLKYAHLAPEHKAAAVARLVTYQLAV